MDWWRSFVENTEASSVLVAAAAVLGGLLGSVFGAKIQADGGRAQAEAAREAATIAAEAQRVAALWTVRQVQVAELMRSAHGLYEACNNFWIVDDEEVWVQIGEKSRELALLWAEVNLIATDDVVEASGRLSSATMRFEGVTIECAPVLHARKALDLLLTPEGTSERVEALRILTRHEADSEYRVRALQDAVPRLSQMHAERLVSYSHKTDAEIHELRQIHINSFRATQRDLLQAAREMLRSQDDAAPTVPPQRRWRRRATT
ncbi:hypothetical protein [Streptomyces sp. NPDC057325]|uniref:hypothetical protein n=1 Tax=unclassified Streptomyces TaxID=2593676 RepID=UPI00362D3A5D